MLLAPDPGWRFALPRAVMFGPFGAGSVALRGGKWFTSPGRRTGWASRAPTRRTQESPGQRPGFRRLRRPDPPLWTRLANGSLRRKHHAPIAAGGGTGVSREFQTRGTRQCWLPPDLHHPSKSPTLWTAARSGITAGIVLSGPPSVARAGRRSHAHEEEEQYEQADYRWAGIAGFWHSRFSWLPSPEKELPLGLERLWPLKPERRILGAEPQSKSWVSGRQ
jgi:hypothetical protein